MTIPLPSAFEFEVGPIGPHFGVLIGEAAQGPRSVVLASPRYGHDDVNDGNAWRLLARLPNLSDFLAQERRQLL